jgi:hypothetical protein
MRWPFHCDYMQLIHKHPFFLCIHLNIIPFFFHKLCWPKNMFRHSFILGFVRDPWCNLFYTLVEFNLDFQIKCITANIGDISSDQSHRPTRVHVYNISSCDGFSYYYRFSDISINSVNPSFIWRLEFSKNG